MDKLMELIERLEKATEGSRELDAEIGRALGFNVEYFPVHEKWWMNREISSERGEHGELPRYTTSLDHAMSLVPEGMWWKFSSRTKVAHIGHNKNGTATDTAKAATAPLALCIAALKARRS
jgi:hypothetical protein